MSSVPSLTQTPSNLGQPCSPSTDHTTGPVSPEHSIEGWQDVAFKKHNAFTNGQCQVAGPDGDFFDGFNNEFDATFYGNVIDFEGMGSWADENHAQGPSAEGSGLLEPQYRTSPLQSAFERQDAQSIPLSDRLLASQMPDTPNQWETATPGPHFAAQLDEAAAIASGGKIEIDRIKTNHSHRKVAKIFDCDEKNCDVTCKRLADLKRHKRNIHGQPPIYACDNCLHRTRGRDDRMKEHCRKRHGDMKGSEKYSSTA